MEVPHQSLVDSLSPDPCTHPIEAICESGGLEKDHRFNEEMIRALAQAEGQSPPAPPTATPTASERRATTERFRTRYPVEFQQFLTAQRQLIPRSQSLRSDLDRARAAVMRLVTDASTEIGALVRLQILSDDKILRDLRSRLAQVSILHFDEAYPINPASLLNHCGQDLNSANAYLKRASAQIVVCPRWLAAASSHPSFGIIQVLGHEIGHSFDSSDLFLPFDRCLAADRNRPSGDLSPLLKEIHADLIGTAMLVSVMRENQVNPQEARSILRDELRTFCSSPRSKSGHPAGEERIRAILNQPGIRQLLECRSQDPLAPSCDLNANLSHERREAIRREAQHRWIQRPDATATRAAPPPQPRQ